MKKLTIIKWVDGLLFLLFIFIMSTGTFLAFTLPHRSGPASVWGMTRHEWGDIHFYLSIFFLILLAAHLFLHLGFVKKMLMGQATQWQSFRIVLGLVSVVLLLLLAFAPMFSPVENARTDGGGKHYRYERLD